MSGRSSSDRLRVSSWGMLVAPLAFFYFYFLVWAVRTGAVPPTSTIESWVLGSMVVRLIVVMSVKRLRLGRVWLIIDVFALEVLLTAVLLLLYIFTRVPVYFSTLNAIVLAWPAALLLVVPVFALYRFGLAMVVRANLGSIIPSAVGLFVLLLIPAEVASISNAPETLSSISRTLLQVLLGEARTASLAPEITLTGLLLYLALTFYVVASVDEGRGVSRTAPLVVAVLGSTIALGWSAIGSIFTKDLLVLFGAPSLIILGVIWWSTRGR